MTKYREILRLLSNKLKTDEIVQACRVSKKTVIKVKKRAAELGISWPLGNDMTDEKLERINALARLARERELTPEELAEAQRLFEEHQKKKRELGEDVD